MFTTELQRTQRLDGRDVTNWSPKRRSFAPLAENVEPGNFDNTVRVVFSAAGIHKKALATCEHLNSEAHSPIVLLVANAAGLGDAAAEDLQ